MSTPITNQLFQQLIPNFAHLCNTQGHSKEEFLNAIKSTYDLSEPKTMMFYRATEQCTFDNIRISKNRDAILLNHSEA